MKLFIHLFLMGFCALSFAQSQQQQQQNKSEVVIERGFVQSLTYEQGALTARVQESGGEKQTIRLAERDLDSFFMALQFSAPVKVVGTVGTENIEVSSFKVDMQSAQNMTLNNPEDLDFLWTKMKQYELTKAPLLSKQGLSSLYLLGQASSSSSMSIDFYFAQIQKYVAPVYGPDQGQAGQEGQGQQEQTMISEGEIEYDLFAAKVSKDCASAKVFKKLASYAISSKLYVSAQADDSSTLVKLSVFAK